MMTRLMLALTVVAVFLAGLALGPWLVSRTAAQQANAGRLASGHGVRDSVAVLPFEHPGDIHDGVKHILAGWVKEVPVALLTDSTLRVARPRSVQELGKIKDDLMAGHRLGTATVLIGKVTAPDDGTKLLVEAELLDVETGLLMWTKSWELDDIFKKVSALNTIRDEIVDGVKKRLEREIARPQPRK